MLGGNIGKTMGKLDWNYLETMEKLNITDTRVWRIFYVVGPILMYFHFTT